MFSLIFFNNTNDNNIEFLFSRIRRNIYTTNNGQSAEKHRSNSPRIYYQTKSLFKIWHTKLRLFPRDVSLNDNTSLCIMRHVSLCALPVFIFRFPSLGYRLFARCGHRRLMRGWNTVDVT